MRNTMILATILLLTGMAHGAGVPELFNYQARLSDENGDPLPTGEYRLEFNIYDGPIEGASLVWGPEIFDPVQVVDGYLNVVLGNSVTLSGAFDEPELYLGIAVGPTAGIAEEILPRQQILSTPYTFRAQRADNGVYPGSIVAYAGSGGAPEGWLKCDGSEVSRTTYATLFAAIGETWGIGDGSTTFNLPALNDGRFLRGGVPGVYQDDSTALPKTPFSFGAGEGVHQHHWRGWRAVSSGERAARSRNFIETDPLDDITLNDGTHIHTLTGGDAETRPKNAAVVWIIKD